MVSTGFDYIKLKVHLSQNVPCVPVNIINWHTRDILW